MPKESADLSKSEAPFRTGVGEKELIEVIERANKAIQGPQTSFRFTVHEGTKAIMVRVLDSETGEVIREIPPEKILDMVAKMWELTGLFVDERR
ncbi:flagellar protein FlaG [Clostridiales bacterium PH28_bin88]|nr:flagellar protein FlaG [Clostridiales bacterium PH28_bin88]